MKRLIATIRCDVRLQARNGFYYATAFVLAIWALLIYWLRPADTQIDLDWLLPAMVLNDLLIVTFYFVGALVLLEKGECTIAAQVVTPLRTGEYLASKAITLGALALAQNLALVWLIHGLGLAILPLIGGVAAAAAICVLAGFAVVARYDSINEYLPPSLPYAAALMLPVLYAAGWEHWLLYLHPMQAPLVLMRAAFEPVAPWELLYGALGSALWLALAYSISLRSFQRFVIARAGGGI